MAEQKPPSASGSRHVDRYDPRMPVAELGEGLLVRLLSALQTRIDSAMGAGLLVAETDGTLRHVAAVGNAALWDEVQIAASSGPILEALTADKVLITDPFDLGRHPDLERLLDVLPKRLPKAIVVVPNTWTSCAQLVTVVYLAASPTDEDLEVIGGHEPLFAYALGLLDYCGEAEAQAEQMVRMVQSRSQIEQAKGMIMTRRSVGPDEAFAALAEHSQRANVKVRDLSAALVAMLAGADATATEQSITAAKELWEDVNTRSE